MLVWRGYWHCLVAISLVLFGGQYAVLSIFSALPFYMIAGMAACKQSKQPSQKRVKEVYEQARKIKPSQIVSSIATGCTDAR